jgi:hypothetical protein
MTAVTNSAGGIPLRGSGGHRKEQGLLTDARPDFDGYCPDASDEKEIPMSSSTNGEPARIGPADELDLASERRDGSHATL